MLLPETLWPSGLRRWLKAPFRKGVGSNPTGVIFREHTAGETFYFAFLCWGPSVVFAHAHENATSRRCNDSYVGRKIAERGFDPRTFGL